jgi:hypothetical protein
MVSLKNETSQVLGSHLAAFVPSEYWIVRFDPISGQAAGRDINAEGSEGWLT